MQYDGSNENPSRMQLRNEETRADLTTAALTIYPLERNCLHKDYMVKKTLLLAILLSKIIFHPSSWWHNPRPSNNQSLLHSWWMHKRCEMGRDPKAWLKTKGPSLLRSRPLVDPPKMCTKRTATWFILLYSWLHSDDLQLNLLHQSEFQYVQY